LRSTDVRETDRAETSSVVHSDVGFVGQWVSNCHQIL
jgi:hypothetical protein